MTGEVSLTGRVLPIGGVKQKLLAAQRAGLTEVFLPQRNEPDLDDVPAEVLRPRNTWSNAADYDAQARKLARMFVDNFAAFEASTTSAVKAAGPRV